jgi:hypothetical protein
MATTGKIVFFSGQELFSAVWTIAVENEATFDGLCGLPKIVPYFRWPIYDRRKLKGKTIESNWAVKH